MSILMKNSKLKIQTITNYQTKRYLNVHEHISYTLLKEACITVPKFFVAKSKKDARKYAEKLNIKNIVLKAQVLTGGRGVGVFKNGLKGGVQMVSTPAEAEEIAGKMLGQYLVTKQTVEAGMICNAVMITERKFPKKEYYCAIMLERSYNGPVLIASSKGGVNIEDIAAKSPEAIIYEPIDIEKGLTKKQANKVAEKIGLKKYKHRTAQMFLDMYNLFTSKDALLIEINPYAQDAKGNFYALDAKFKFDDYAAYRQKMLFSKRDLSQEDEKEVDATKYHLNYIALQGNIGCMVNGAGLAMATMDIISLYGGTPANFLDVGGSASARAVKEAFKIIIADPKAASIFVNIFGGIMRCDIIAQGVLAATKELQIKIPIVVRLQGTNVEKANKLLKESGLEIQSEDDFDKAAKLAVKLANTKATC